MLTARDVARYFLAIQDEEAGDLISNLKLQKLLYYAQGVHLALLDEPLFNEQIKAWAHGPVVPQVWHEYKEHGGGPLPADPDFDAAVIPAAQRDLLDEVHNVYGQFSAWRLREMTHAEPPWKDAFASSSNVVTRDSMKEYFKPRVHWTEG
jgi:uncharacterized phage-associated protein